MTTDEIESIRLRAKEIFLKENIQFTSYIDERGYRRDNVEVFNADLVRHVFSMIFDAGTLYLVSEEDLGEIWDNMRNRETGNYTLNWLMQAATKLFTLEFSNVEQFRYFTEHLANAYGMHRGKIIPSKDDNANIIDQTRFETLPDRQEQHRLLRDNPWFFYLATLQLSTHEIFNEIYQARPELFRQAQSDENV